MGFLKALGFLTIFKVPQNTLGKKVSSTTTLFNFTIIGLLLGLVLSAVYYLSSLLLPPLLGIILIVGLEIVLSGGIHIDGLSDLSDGIFSGEKVPEKIIGIMKKGDTGVFGVISIVFDILFRITLLYFVQRYLKDVYLFLPVIFFMPAFGRSMMVYLLEFFRPRPKSKSLTGFFDSKGSRKATFFGLSFILILFFLTGSIIFTLYSGSSVNISGAGTTVIILVLFFIGLATILLLIVSAYLVARFSARRLEGITGDVIGAVNEVTEIWYLLIVLISVKYLGLY